MIVENGIVDFPSLHEVYVGHNVIRESSSVMVAVVDANLYVCGRSLFSGVVVLSLWFLGCVVVVASSCLLLLS